MSPIFIAGIIGVVLGIVLVIFTAANRDKIPHGTGIAFIAVGVLIALSGIFVTIGASGLAG
ncbi:MAG: hypothetical protein PUA82_00690 [Eubacteriales bacterium]|nr:hypothetical protein [Eubacteriales bacterium]